MLEPKCRANTRFAPYKTRFQQLVITQVLNSEFKQEIYFTANFTLIQNS